MRLCFAASHTLRRPHFMPPPNARAANHTLRRGSFYKHPRRMQFPCGGRISCRRRRSSFPAAAVFHAAAECFQSYSAPWRGRPHHGRAPKGRRRPKTAGSDATQSAGAYAARRPQLPPPKTVFFFPLRGRQPRGPPPSRRGRPLKIVLLAVRPFWPLLSAARGGAPQLRAAALSGQARLGGPFPARDPAGGGRHPRPARPPVQNPNFQPRLGG